MSRRLTIAFLAAAAVSGLIGCASPPGAAAPSAAARDLAPSGTLRAAINIGNPILAARGPEGGDPTGVSVDLARELAKRLGVPVSFTVYPAAGQVTAAAKTGAWDVAFVAVDPARSADFLQTQPYVVIEGAYLVRGSSPLTANEQVDRDGVRVAVGKGSAYDLFLTRELKHAQLVRTGTSPAVVNEFLAQNLDVAAGVRQQLEADMKRLSGQDLRLLPGRFMVIEQAMGAPKGREAGLPYLRSFLEDVKASGFVADALKRHRIEGAAVAPAAK